MTTFKNDMTMMFVMHDALRRDLDRIARLTARTDDDPKHILRTAAGWEMFKSYLHAHHTSEDELLWPPLRKALPDDAHGTALLDAMEAEHAAIDPLIDGFDAALADRDSGPARLGELADALASGLRAHLTHEENEGLPLIDSIITAEQWQAFSAGGRQADRRRRLPVHAVGARRRAPAGRYVGARLDALADQGGLPRRVGARLCHADTLVTPNWSLWFLAAPSRGSCPPFGQERDEHEQGDPRRTSSRPGVVRRHPEHRVGQ